MTVAVPARFNRDEDPRVVRFSVLDNTETEIPIEIHTLGQIDGLSMILNPESWNVSMQQVAESVKTLGGFAVFHWGSRPDTITAEGWSPAFMLSPDEFDVLVANNNILAAVNSSDVLGLPGLQAAYRRYTRGFREFQRLLTIFRHNGVSIIDGGLPRTNGRGRIKIEYQNIAYHGHFTTFEWSDDDENPYSIRYSFEFTVEKERDLRGYERRGPLIQELAGV